MIQQWDYYFAAFAAKTRRNHRDPGEYVRNQSFPCFFNDSVCGRNLEWWGRTTSCGRTIFPTPFDLAEFDQGHPADSATCPWRRKTKVLAANACKLYGIDMSALPAGISRAAQAAQAAALIHRLISAFLLAVAARSRRRQSFSDLASDGSPSVMNGW